VIFDAEETRFSMHYLRNVTLWFLVLVVSSCLAVRTSACHVTIHYTKAQIEAADLRLYERDLSAWNRNPTTFDEKKPAIRELLGSQQVYENDLAERNSHPVKFEYEHSYLSKVLEGDVLYHEKHPNLPPLLLLPPGVVDAPDPNQPTHSSEPGGGGTPPPTSSGQPGVGAASVPEPSSGVLILTPTILGLVMLIHNTTRRLTGRPRIRSRASELWSRGSR
jgi:hypothetical protein